MSSHDANPTFPVSKSESSFRNAVIVNDKDDVETSDAQSSVKSDTAVVTTKCVTPKTAPPIASKPHNFFFFNSLSRKKRHEVATATSSSPPKMENAPSSAAGLHKRPSLKRSLTTRTEYLKDHIKSGTATFFGVPDNVEECMQKWTNRRLRHCSRRYGLKDSVASTDYAPSEDFCIDGSRPDIGTISLQSGSGIRGKEYARSISKDSHAVDDLYSKRLQLLHRRDSVAKMAWDGLSSMIRSSPKRRLSLKTRLREPSRSFSPFDVALQATRSASSPMSEPPSTAVTAAPSPPFGPPPGSAVTEDSVFTSSSLPRQQQQQTVVAKIETPKSAPLPLSFTPHKQHGGHIHFSNDVGIDEIDTTLKTPAEQETPPVAKMEESKPKTSSEISKYKKRRFSLRSPISTLEKQPKVYRHLSLEPSTVPHDLNPLDDVFFDLIPLNIKDEKPEGQQVSTTVPKVAQSPSGAVVFCGNQCQRSVRWSLFDEEAAEKDVAGVLRRPSIDAKQQKLEFYVPLGNVAEEAIEESRPSSSNVLILKRIPYEGDHRFTIAEPILGKPQAEISEEIELPSFAPESQTRHRRAIREITVDRKGDSFPKLLESRFKPKISMVETRRTPSGQHPFIPMQNRLPYHYSPFKAQKSRGSQEEPLTISNFWNKILNRALYSTGRRKFGQGVVGKFFGRVIKKPTDLEPHVKRQLDDFDDYRPYFTYWIMTVHILVLLIALITYGFGPFGFSRTQYSSLVLQTSLVLEQVAYFEQENFWLGPRFADLVHLGAKYSPCMRRDKNIAERIEKIRLMEKESACCIRNDRTGCVQASKNNCPTMLATWFKWDPAAGNTYENRSSGTVCSQDPRECRRPSSIEPFKWPDDITLWPICTEPSQSRNLPHTRCELTGRPCCIGILGECRITTREYCDFVKGYFHDEATLCSQVSCLSEVCGMIPFVNEKIPDQFYRLFISIFLHAGILHCIFTLIVQYLLMRDLEKLIGWFRLSIIYLGSGIFGNLASAVFVPYEPEVGPAGSQFGLLAGLLVDAIYSRHMIVEPWKAIAQLLGVLFFLFILGLLPWVDNWAHAFGFLSGLLFSLALFPYIQFKENDFRKRLVIVIVCLFSIAALFVALLILFYFEPLWKCNSCTYFNCIPITDHLCDNEGLSLQPLPF